MRCIAMGLLMMMLPALVQAERQVGGLRFSQQPATIEAAGEQRLYPLMALTTPGVQTPVYAVKGLVRYSHVPGDGYLQLTSHFGAKGAFFSKTLAPSGPLAKITGSSDWRPFTLPFYAAGGDPETGKPLLPEKLSLAVFLPESGTVSVRNVGVYEYLPGEDPLASSGQWFGTDTGAWIGAVAGSAVGFWGAVIGLLAGRGRARVFVTSSVNVLLLAGVLGTAAGLFALMGGQPYAVYFPLLLIGVIILAVFGALRGNLTARYEHLELQKMQAMDV